MDLNRALADESEALAAARQEVHAVNEARRHDLVLLRSKFAECVQIVDIKREEYEVSFVSV